MGRWLAGIALLFLLGLSLVEILDMLINLFK